MTSLNFLLSQKKARQENQNTEKSEPVSQQILVFPGVPSGKGHFSLFIIHIRPIIQLSGNNILQFIVS